MYNSLHPKNPLCSEIKADQRLFLTWEERQTPSKLNNYFEKKPATVTLIKLLLEDILLGDQSSLCE